MGLVEEPELDESEIGGPPSAAECAAGALQRLGDEVCAARLGLGARQFPEAAAFCSSSSLGRSAASAARDPAPVSRASVLFIGVLQQIELSIYLPMLRKDFQQEIFCGLAKVDWVACRSRPVLLQFYNPMLYKEPEPVAEEEELFAQRRAAPGPPPEIFSGDIEATLQGLLDKAQEELEPARQKETSDLHTTSN